MCSYACGPASRHLHSSSAFRSSSQISSRRCGHTSATTLRESLSRVQFDATALLLCVRTFFGHCRGALPRCFQATLATNLTRSPAICVHSVVSQCDQRRDTLAQLHCRVRARVLRLSRVHQRQRGPRPRVPGPLHTAPKAAGSAARQLCLWIKLVRRSVCQRAFALDQTVWELISRVPLSPCELCCAFVCLGARPQARPWCALRSTCDSELAAVVHYLCEVDVSSSIASHSGPGRLVLMLFRLVGLWFVGCTHSLAVGVPLDVARVPAHARRSHPPRHRTSPQARHNAVHPDSRARVRSSCSSSCRIPL